MKTKEPEPDTKIIAATYLPKELYQRFKAAAEVEQRPVSSLIRILIIDFLEERGR